MLSTKVVIPCKECKRAIVHRDIFTGNIRYSCGANISEVLPTGDGLLMSDNGCEFGVRNDN